MSSVSNLFSSAVSANVFILLFGILIASEIWVLVKSGKNAKNVDNGSVVVLNVCFVAVLSIDYALLLQDADHLQFKWIFTWAGIAILLIGMILRWGSIWFLGRYFTGRVQIQDDHELISRGIYRWVRHPSYTGGILIFMGIAMSINNWLALIVNVLLIAGAYLYRIRIEERALMNYFGEAYKDYMKRTWKLFPYLL
ncbi:protein-S-isoprenylcysteine O-methyltransferase Ste14 [Paenibacillus harenae]|uniref:Protein-S-isoprenylcysteine O-methyltransferase Ste14 n=1 Tax=Paenibacillus harenae TaxID=306543 RepID=A0ABT9U5H8_PAEHA|nr:protein-S-isoprenylcysteine O-methyltransferase Ste14 [Paenibacillus harenae]